MICSTNVHSGLAPAALVKGAGTFGMACVLTEHIIDYTAQVVYVIYLPQSTKHTFYVCIASDLFCVHYLYHIMKSHVTCIFHFPPGFSI
jgi:hypothetical protein